MAKKIPKGDFKHMYIGQYARIFRRNAPDSLFKTSWFDFPVKLYLWKDTPSDGSSVA